MTAFLLRRSIHARNAELNFAVNVSARIAKTQITNTMTQVTIEQDFGATFSGDRTYRYSLWRIWDRSLPLVMFIGLNPSKANLTPNTPTSTWIARR